MPVCKEITVKTIMINYIFRQSLTVEPALTLKFQIWRDQQKGRDNHVFLIIIMIIILRHFISLASEMIMHILSHNFLNKTCICIVQYMNLRHTRHTNQNLRIISFFAFKFLEPVLLFDK
jgi:hypothetical protein